MQSLMSLRFNRIYVTQHPFDLKKVMKAPLNQYFLLRALSSVTVHYFCISGASVYCHATGNIALREHEDVRHLQEGTLDKNRNKF